MKRTGIILTAAAFALVSCVKDKSLDGTYPDRYITLDAAPAVTKGFLSTEGLKVDGTSFQMFDYLSGYNGTISGHTSGEEFQYFSNSLTYKASAENWKWVFGDVSSPTSYRWTRTGTHHFFGWMLKDATEAGLQSSTFFTTWTPGEKSLIVGKTLTADDSQYDFLYSDVVPVDVLGSGVPSSVPIPMKHLFGALGMTIKNNSKVDVVVYSVRLLNFPNNGSATLTYDMSSGVNLAEPNPARSATVFWPNKISSPITLKNIEDAAGNKTYDCYTGAEVTDLSYRMAWPVTYAALEPTVTGTDSDGNNVYSSDSPLIEVDCKVGTAERSVLKMRFPKMADATAAIQAGKKTQLNLLFADKQITLRFISLPWDYEEYPMAFEGDAINATQLKFIEGSFVNGGKLVDANGRHDVIQLTSSSNPAWVARGSFKIYTPVNARLSVGLSGDVDAFTVTLESGDTYTGAGTSSITVDPNRDGGQITIGVKPKGTPSSGKRVFLHFAINNNGRDSDADSEINRDNYVVTIP